MSNVTSKRYVDFDPTTVPGVKLHSNIKLCVPLQSLPGSAPPFASMSMQESSEVTGLNHTNDILQERWRKDEALLRSQLDASMSVQSNRYCRDRPPAISTIYTSESATQSCLQNCQSQQLNGNNVILKTTSCNDDADMHDICRMRQKAQHVNIKWRPAWQFAYLISSFQRKRLPLQHVKTNWDQETGW